MLGAILSLLLGYFVYARFRSDSRVDADSTRWPDGPTVRSFLRDSRPLYIFAGSQVVNQWLPVILIGELVGLVAAAEFQVAFRIALTVGLLQMGITTVIGPRMAKAWRDGDIDSVMKIFRTALKMSILIATFCSIPLFVYASFFLSLFGEYEYSLIKLLYYNMGE